MDSKRKADGSGAADSDDRSSKRRRTSFYDLSRGESKDSTTAYGLAFVEQLRRTADKSGRLIATSFETLIPREGNSAYYKKTRLPVSLEIIEEKLNNGDFKNLAELESFFKRMISNAKEFYPRSSSIFDDAERIRKTLSNYMTKNNPAYNRRGYQAAPTPLPPRNPDEEDDDEDDEDDEDDQEEDEDDDEEEEEEEEPTSRRRSIVVKRGRGRPRKSDVMDSPKPAAPAQSENDQEYLNVPYKSLNFQRAQEKVVEEVLRHQEPEYEGPYFEPFINLPPRALKDYYRIVSDPLSLRKLQKIVKGTQSRHDTPGVSEFKNWAAFEERSQLLWENAYFYNEEGSEIYELARELEKIFRAQLKKAQAAVPDPAPSRIRLRTGDSSRRATLSAAPGTESPGETPAPTNGHAEGESPADSAKQAEEATATPVPLPPPVPKIPLEYRRQREGGKGVHDALLTRLHLRAHQSIYADQPIVGSVFPDAQYMQQAATINLPSHVNRVFIAPGIPDALMERHFALWVLIDKQLLKQVPHAFPDHTQQDRVFEVMLRPGVNVIETHVIAAIPAEERVEGGPEAELEVFTAYVNLAKN